MQRVRQKPCTYMNAYRRRPRYEVSEYARGNDRNDIDENRVTRMRLQPQ